MASLSMKLHHHHAHLVDTLILFSVIKGIFHSRVKWQIWQVWALCPCNNTFLCNPCHPLGVSSKEPSWQCRRHKRQVWPLGWEDLEVEVTTRSSILAWRIPWKEKLVGYRVHKVTVRHSTFPPLDSVLRPSNLCDAWALSVGHVSSAQHLH